MTTAQAKWKNIAASIAISGEEERQNSGKSRLINLLDAKTQQAKLSLKREVTSALFAATTATKKIQSLNVMLDATSSVQDINSTTYSWWQANTDSVGSFATNGLSKMRTAWTTITKVEPNTAPDTIVTTDTVYNYYEGSLTPNMRYAVTDKSGNASFENLMFKTSKVFFDANATSGCMYMFPSQHFYMVINSNANIAMTPFVKPANQDAKVAQVILMTEFVTNARRKGYKLTGITA